jgi:hypothetical protein
VAAGDIVPWSYIATRVAISTIVADTTTYGGTETSLATIAATLINGLTYGVYFNGRVSADVAADLSGLRLREDTVIGNQLNFTNVYVGATTGNGFTTVAYGEYTAGATASKTFVLTGQRTGGSGTAHRVRASANAPAFLMITLIPS